MPSMYVCVYSVVMCACDPGAGEGETDGTLELQDKFLRLLGKFQGKTIETLF